MTDVSQADATPPEWVVTEEQLKLFQGFMEKKYVLVADPNQSVRSSLSKVLGEMGVRANQILLASNLHEANEQIRSKKPEIVICDYHLDKQYGLELVPMHREACPVLENRLFILVTGNSSESAVAEAAEEDVDAFILKPFTSSSIRCYLVKSALAKAQPSPYRAKLTQGKQQLASGLYNEAVGTFVEAMSLTFAPSMACYYIGQSYEKLVELEKAESNYKEGLNFNKIHFRCLVATFDLCASQGRSEEAYDFMRTIVQSFPISPQRLSKAIELAVRTHNFEDLGYYYDLFTNLEERRVELRKCVSAALVVGAMYHLRQQNGNEAIRLLQNAGITAAGNPVILREIVLLLCRSGLPEAADSFLKRFEPEDRTKPDFLCAELSVMDAMPTVSAEDIIVRGRRLLKDGIQDPILHRIMIRREKQVGHVEEAERLLTEATTVWPESVKTFETELRMG